MLILLICLVFGIIYSILIVNVYALTRDDSAEVSSFEQTVRRKFFTGSNKRRKMFTEMALIVTILGFYPAIGIAIAAPL
jgi:preprotein translocase subunit SecG